MKYQQENIFMTGVTGKVLQFFLTTSFAKGTQSQTCGGLPLVPSSQTRNIHYKPTDIYKYVITVSLAFYNSGLFKKKSTANIFNFKATSIQCVQTTYCEDNIDVTKHIFFKHCRKYPNKIISKVK